MKLRVGNSESIVSGLDKVCTQSGHDSSKWRLALRLFPPEAGLCEVVEEPAARRSHEGSGVG